jgi:hypothetical protein
MGRQQMAESREQMTSSGGPRASGHYHPHHLLLPTPNPHPACGEMLRGLPALA